MVENKVALLFSGYSSGHQFDHGVYEGISPITGAVYDRAREIFRRRGQRFNLDYRVSIDGDNDVIGGQYALFVAKHALFSQLRESLQGFRYAATAGHSIGQHNALVASGAVDFEQGMILGGQEMEHIQHVCMDMDGGLLVLKGQFGQYMDEMESELSGRGIFPALFNSPRQMVLGGLNPGLQYVREDIDANWDGQTNPTVNYREFYSIGPTHTPYLQAVADSHKTEIAEAQISGADISLVGNTSATPIRNPDDIRDELYSHPTHPVLWSQSIREMLSDGIRTFIVVDVGQNDSDRCMLREWIHHIDGDAQVWTVNNGASLEQVVNQIAA
jgi:[acyl-carrier-protein] S-malonyltransferase